MVMDEPLPEISFNQICPEFGVGNPENADSCLVCERDLTVTLLFMEDDSFDLEVTREHLVEYRKSFWEGKRTGKINTYQWIEMENIKFGHPITRFRFEYGGSEYVIPLKEENYEKLKDILTIIRSEES